MLVGGGHGCSHDQADFGRFVFASSSPHSPGDHTRGVRVAKVRKWNQGDHPSGVWLIVWNQWNHLAMQGNELYETSG